MTSEQTEPVISPTGAAEIAYAMNRLIGGHNATERGLHTSFTMDPRTDEFGTFNERWEYTEGCTVDTEFGGGKVGELIVAVRTDDGKKRVVSIGRTPAEWNPKSGSQKVLEGAGAPGDFLAAIVDNPGADDQTITYRYLDPESIAGVVIKHDGQMLFNANPSANRQPVQVRGTIEKVVGLAYIPR